jgi:nitroreductase
VEALDAIARRRSIGRLGEPAPSGDALGMILQAGAQAPDHGELRPFRFVVLQGPAKDAFGSVLEEAYVRRCQAMDAEPVPAKREKERTKLGRAPVVVVVAAVRQPSDKIPWEEQQAAASAACQNVLLAATALGYGSMWRTGEPSYDPHVKRALGFDEDAALVGWLYLGTPLPGSTTPVKSPTADGLVSTWVPPA